MKSNLKKLTVFLLLFLMMFGNSVRVLAADNNSLKTEIQWEKVSISQSGYLNSIAFDTTNNIYVAVGVEGINGLIMMSTDAKTWEKADINEIGMLQKVIWDGKKFIAVGERGTLVTSVDGKVWEKHYVNSTYALSDIVWNGQVYVAVGGDNTVFISEDGFQWSQVFSGVFLYPRGYINTIMWDGKQFLAYGPSSIFKSLDGKNWTRYSGVYYGYSAIAYSGERYVLVGDGPSVYHSTNGLSWKWVSVSTSCYKTDVIWDGTNFIATNTYGKSILISQDGVSWEESIIDGSSYKINSIVWTGKHYVLVGDNGIILIGTKKIPDSNPPILKIPQDITIEATGTRTQVDLGKATAEDESPVTISNNGLQDYSIGTTEITWTAVDSSGNTSTAVQKVNIVDTTPPDIKGYVIQQPNMFGWYNSDVTVSFEASDIASCIYSITPDVTLALEGENQYVEGCAVDFEGNSTSLKVDNINIDKTKPTISLVNPLNKIYKSDDSIKIDYNVNDNLSGIQSTIVTINGKEVSNGQTVSLASNCGKNELIIRAIDKAGNESILVKDFEVAISSVTNIDPDVINLKSNGGKNSVTAYIEIPLDYDISQVDLSSFIMNVNGTKIKAERSSIITGSNNSNTIMVKFNRAEIISILEGYSGKVELEIFGKLTDGKVIIGSDVVNIIK